MPGKLDELVVELAEADPEDRIAILIDRAGSLKPWPARLERCRDPAHRVRECQSPVYLVAEGSADRIALFADAPIEAPTVRGFVAMLVEGLDGTTVAAVEGVPDDLVERARIPEILGPRRIDGFRGIVRRLQAEVRRAVDASASGGSIASPSGRDI